MQGHTEVVDLLVKAYGEQAQHLQLSVFVSLCVCCIIHMVAIF